MNKIDKPNLTRFCKVKVGEYFKVAREQGNDIYVKHSGYITLFGTRLSYRPLHGGTIVEIINI